MSGAGPQLGLPFASTPLFAPDFMEAPSNAEALAWLERVADWPGGRLALWGEAGTGKSHLLHLWSARHGGEVIAGAALALRPPFRPVAIDDADQAPETPLFHLLNAASEAGHPVLLAGRDPPARWPTRLPDLASRLRAITAARIGQPDEAMLRALLARLLTERQLAVSEAVRDWLLARLPRTAGAMREAAIRLDRASLAARRAVTRGTAAGVLADILREDEVFEQPAAGPSPDQPAFL